MVELKAYAFWGLVERATDAGYFVFSIVFVLGVIVFMHELGHFLLAKLFGVRVLQFSLGFPPKALSKKIGQTEYILSWIPLGGYVRMAGENEESDEPWAFSAQSPLKKLLIIAGGPISNFLGGILVLWAVFFFVGDVVPDMTRPVISGTLPDSPAAKLQLQSGDSIFAINDIPVKTWTEMDSIIKAHPDELVQISFVRQGVAYAESVKLFSRVEPKGRKVGKLGVYPSIRSVNHNLISAFKRSIGLFSLTLCEVAKFVSGAFTGKANLKDVGGPILIAEFTVKSAKSGLSQLFIFLAVLSLNLGIINLFPLPLLDGGQMAFYAIEAVTRKRLPQRAREITQTIGFIILISLMILVSINDIMRILGK